MKKFILCFVFSFLLCFVYAQVAINTDGSTVSSPDVMLEIKKPIKSKVRIRSTGFSDSSQLELSNITQSGTGTSMLLSASREEGLYISSSSDIGANTQDSIFSIYLTGIKKSHFGMNVKSPSSHLHIHDPVTALTTLRLTNTTTGVVGNQGLTLSINGLTASLVNTEAGNLNFGTSNIVWAGFNSSGNLGVGFTNSTERLGVSGNINLSNANKGIILDGQDRPFITRGFDPFTSGNYNGLGRWGLFMEPSRLTLGIPATTGKAFEFATYNSNSTRNTLLNITETGSVTRPASNSANLLPVAFGTLDGTFSPPLILNGSGNFTAVRTGTGFYSITVAGEFISDATHTCLVTIIRNSVSNGTFAWATPSTSPPAGNLLVKTGNDTDQKFSFLIYRAN